MKITVYSSQRCGNCMAAKAYLDSKNISYEEVMVDQDPEILETLISKGVRNMPFIQINDVEIKGFKPQEIDKALNQ